MRAFMVIVVVAVAFITGCGQGSEPRSYRMDQVPPELAGPVAAADTAIRTLQERLGGRLFEELGRGGPVAAIDVCRVEAEAITRAVAAERGISLGRTSERLRNPVNAPRDWVRPHLERASGKRAEEVAAVAVDLGDRVGLLRPIPMGEPCLQCHGAPTMLAPGVEQTLKEAYPEDRAVGFATGDLRGFIWAEAPKR